MIEEPPEAATTTAFCTYCGTAVADTKVACPSCGYDPTVARAHCAACGAATKADQAVCLACGTSLGPVLSPATVAPPAQVVPAPNTPPTINVNVSPPPKSRTVAAVLAIVLSIFAAHKWYLGKKTPALIMNGALLVGICGAIFILPLLLIVAVAFTSIAEGVIYLTKTDEQFEEIYIVQGRDWF
jgi:TM2 domain-containing membrane protein YozV